MFYSKKNACRQTGGCDLKWEKSAQGAIAQIKDRHYTDALKEYRGNLLLAGINYNRETKTHTCVIEQLTKED